jgi:hypothetical protein
MIFPTHDTSWALSVKGNYWRRLNGVVLVVGQFKANDFFWAMRDSEFLKGKFRTKEQAQRAAETGADGEEYCSSNSDEMGW